MKLKFITVLLLLFSCIVRHGRTDANEPDEYSNEEMMKIKPTDQKFGRFGRLLNSIKSGLVSSVANQDYDYNKETIVISDNICDLNNKLVSKDCEMNGAVKYDGDNVIHRTYVISDGDENEGTFMSPVPMPDKFCDDVEEVDDMPIRPKPRGPKDWFYENDDFAGAEKPPEAGADCPRTYPKTARDFGTMNVDEYRVRKKKPGGKRTEARNKYFGLSTDNFDDFEKLTSPKHYGGKPGVFGGEMRKNLDDEYLQLLVDDNRNKIENERAKTFHDDYPKNVHFDGPRGPKGFENEEKSFNVEPRFDLDKCLHSGRPNPPPYHPMAEYLNNESHNFGDPTKCPRQKIKDYFEEREGEQKKLASNQPGPFFENDFPKPYAGNGEFHKSFDNDYQRSNYEKRYPKYFANEPSKPNEPSEEIFGGKLAKGFPDEALKGFRRERQKEFLGETPKAFAYDPSAALKNSELSRSYLGGHAGGFGSPADKSPTKDNEPTNKNVQDKIKNGLEHKVPHPNAIHKPMTNPKYLEEYAKFIKPYQFPNLKNNELGKALQKSQESFAKGNAAKEIKHSFGARKEYGLTNFCQTILPNENECTAANHINNLPITSCAKEAKQNFGKIFPNDIIYNNSNYANSKVNNSYSKLNEVRDFDYDVEDEDDACFNNEVRIFDDSCDCDEDGGYVVCADDDQYYYDESCSDYCQQDDEFEPDCCTYEQEVITANRDEPKLDDCEPEPTRRIDTDRVPMQQNADPARTSPAVVYTDDVEADCRVAKNVTNPIGENGVDVECVYPCDPTGVADLCPDKSGQEIKTQDHCMLSDTSPGHYVYTCSDAFSEPCPCSCENVATDLCVDPCSFANIRRKLYPTPGCDPCTSPLPDPCTETGAVPCPAPRACADPCKKTPSPTLAPDTIANQTREVETDVPDVPHQTRPVNNATADVGAKPPDQSTVNHAGRTYGKDRGGRYGVKSNYALKKQTEKDFMTSLAKCMSDVPHNVLKCFSGITMGKRRKQVLKEMSLMTKQINRNHQLKKTERNRSYVQDFCCAVRDMAKKKREK